RTSVSIVGNTPVCGRNASRHTRRAACRNRHVKVRRCTICWFEFDFANSLPTGRGLTDERLEYRSFSVDHSGWQLRRFPLPRTGGICSGVLSRQLPAEFFVGKTSPSTLREQILGQC